MGIAITAATATQAVLGYDMLTGQIHQISAVNRVLQGVGLTGSTAIADTKVDVYIDTVKVAEVYNTKLLIGNNDDIVPLDNLYVPAGAALHVIVTKIPTTNNIYCYIKTSNV